MKYQVIRISKGGIKELAKEFDNYDDADRWVDTMNAVPYMDCDFEIEVQEGIMKDYDKKFIERFSILQDRACGYSDEDEMTEQEFAERYPNKKAMAKEAKYWLEMYYGTGNGIGCTASEERYDDNPRVRQQWRNDVAKFKRFIKACEKES